MINELRKSINSILYERISSPFYGTLVLSWLIWNWKIVFVTIIEDDAVLGSSKFKYISDNLLSNNWTLIWYPLISTFILICILPFITTGAYWISLTFRKWNSDIRNKIEQNQLITLQQSIELRLEMKNQEEKFNKLLIDKNKEIDRLTTLIDTIKQEYKTESENRLFVFKDDKDKNNDLQSEENIHEEYIQFRENKILYKVFNDILRAINIDETLSYSVDSESISYFSSHGIIEKTDKIGLYRLTSKGKLFQKYYSEDKFLK